MNIKNRIKRIEANVFPSQSNGAGHGITLDQWRRLASGADILPEIPESGRAAFIEWQGKADERRREAAETAKLFEGNLC